MAEHLRQYYILNEAHEAVPSDLDGGPRWFEEGRDRVGETQVGPYRVSTVFLGLDHRLGQDGPPMLFETMVFGSDGLDLDMDRSSTWVEAEAMHANFVARYSAKPS